MAPAERERLTFPAARRLRRKWEFDQLYASGRRLGNSHFGITVHPNDVGLARLGLAVASKPFGGSVPRNRIRRLIRESFRLRQHDLPDVDLVVSARPRAKDASAVELRASLEGLWDKVKVECAPSSRA
ncbi:MAG TPA: ribonuclease P protein component [Steroidobacteraceae bacterium]|nr:ribonuclease P protein component [Steroidobacteraceae bacterium]